MNRFEELAAAYLEGSLRHEEVRELARILNENPSLRASFVDDVQIDRLLQVDYEPEDSRFVQNVIAELKADERNFLHAIMGDLKQAEKTSLSGAPDLAETFPRSASFRHLAAGLIRQASSWAAWRPARVWGFAALAAGALALFGLASRFNGRDAGLERVFLEASSPNVSFKRSGGWEPVKGPLWLSAGDQIQTDFQGIARLSFDQGKTLLAMATNSIVEVLPARGGRRLALRAGAIEAQVAPQPEGQPMRWITGTGEYTVRGTEFTLFAQGDQTRLDVQKGVVAFRRFRQWRSLEVSTGHYLISGSGGMKAPAAANVITVNFGPEGMDLPEGCVNDSGQQFDARLGYGWDGPPESGHLAGEYWMEPNGNLVLARRGRITGQRTARGDSLLDSFVSTGWRNHSQTWRFRLANGRYQITLAVGDSEYEQAPHHVSMEGQRIVDSVHTDKGQFHFAQDVPVEITDGELTLVVGGYDGPQLTQDGSFDSTLNFIRIKTLNVGR